MGCRATCTDVFRVRLPLYTLLLALTVTGTQLAFSEPELLFVIRVARMGEERGVYRVLLGETGGKETTGET